MQVRFLPGAICGLSVLLVHALWWVFSPGSLVFLATQKPTSPNSNSTRIEVPHANLLRLPLLCSLFIHLLVWLFPFVLDIWLTHLMCCLHTQADTQLQNEKRSFHQTALDYVVKLQEVNEKKKFEFVETVSWYLGWH